jgi:4-hydroxy-tetrahydrodipicolinate reductase
MKGFEDHDLRLTEIYHTEKSDAPSGTAITAEGNCETDYDKWHSEYLRRYEASRHFPVRTPCIKRNHLEIYNSTVDQIEIKHTEHSRRDEPIM